MIRFPLALATIFAIALPGWSQEPAPPTDTGAPTESEAIRKRMASYLEAFNSREAAAVAGFWTADGVSVAGETGARTEGRDALQSEFASFFEANPAARLSGEVSGVRKILPNVAVIEGTTTLFLPDSEPVSSTFNAVLVKEGDQWLIGSSHERDLPAPPTAYDALKELEWMVGRWQDQTDGALVETNVGWTADRAFLVRSFNASFEDGDDLRGTQVIGWDPLSKQIRTWTFNSDGSFGQGTISRHDDEWVLKMTQTLADGRLAEGTRILTRGGDDTMTLQTVGATVDGAPMPTSEAVTVVRVASPAGGDDPAPAAENNAALDEGENR